MLARIKKFLLLFFISGILFCLMPGCDSGEKAIDEATGNRALKQYHRAKENVKQIEEKQKERYDQIDDDQEQENQENQKNQ